MDGSISFQFQGQAALFSDRSAPEWDALLLAADRCTIRSIFTIAPLEDHNKVVYRKPDFMFGDVALAIIQQLLTKEGQWKFTVREESTTFHQARTLHLLIFSIDNDAKEDDSVFDRTTNSVYVGVLTPHSYNLSRPTQSVLGLHTNKVG